MEQLRQEFRQYANSSQELGVLVFIQGERYDGWCFTDAFDNAPESDFVRIFKSLACRAATAAGLTGGQAGPEDWQIWLRTTFATLYRGDPRDLQAALGHSDLKLTMNIYRKPILERQQAAMDELEARLAGKVVPIKKAQGA